MIEKIIDLTTQNEIIRNYTEEEIAEVEAAKAKAETQRLLQETKANEKAALLAQLGLTADEMAALLS